MPRRLRPTAPIATDAVLVGDPGRALLLAQELLTEPKMSNHARGLWGYSGKTPDGNELTIQSTGMGGPSAGLVLADLAELGVRRAIRVGTCCGYAEGLELGEMVTVAQALAASDTGDAIEPDAGLARALAETMRSVVAASLDIHPGEAIATPAGADVADMQTATLLARARALRIEAAALLIVTEKSGAAEVLSGEPLEQAEKRAGQIASAPLSG
jgi:uridine phosphorylase